MVEQYFQWSTQEIKKQFYNLNPKNEKIVKTEAEKFLFLCEVEKLGMFGM